VMVSRQETARPLLTPGEVMQLPPDEQLVMLAGTPPIRAQKLRYFEDRNFTARRLDPPKLGGGDAPNRPNPRANDWEGRTAAFDARLVRGGMGSSTGGDDEGGRQRVPGVEQDAPKSSAEEIEPERILDDAVDPGEAEALREMSSGAELAKRAHALDRSDDDLLPGL